MKKVFLHKFILILILLFSFSGCSYTLQSKAHLPFQDVYLRNIHNNTLEPGLQDRMRRIAYEALMENGFNLTSDADKVIDIEIQNYRLITLSEIGLTTVEYEIKIDTKVILYSKDGKKIKEFYPSSPFSTVFRTTKEIQRVIASRDLALESLLWDICENLVRTLITDASDSKI